jgi:hypothetical protein
LNSNWVLYKGLTSAHPINQSINKQQFSKPRSLSSTSGTSPLARLLRPMLGILFIGYCSAGWWLAINRQNRTIKINWPINHLIDLSVTHQVAINRLVNRWIGRFFEHWLRLVPYPSLLLKRGPYPSLRIFTLPKLSCCRSRSVRHWWNHYKIFWYLIGCFFVTPNSKKTCKYLLKNIAHMLDKIGKSYLKMKKKITVDFYPKMYFLVLKNLKHSLDVHCGMKCESAKFRPNLYPFVCFKIFFCIIL